MKRLIAAALSRLRQRLRYSRFSSIQSIVAWSFSIMIVLTIGTVALLLHEKFSASAERSAFTSSGQIVAQASYNLEDYVRGLSNFYRAIEKNMLAGGQWDGIEVDKQLDTLMVSRDDIVSIALFSEDGALLKNRPAAELRSSANPTAQGWFQAAVRVPNHLAFSLPHIENLYKGNYKWVVSMSKRVTVIRDGQPQEVILLVDINFKQIDVLSSRISLARRGYVYIIDEGAGNIVYHPQQQLMYMGLKRESIERALVADDSYIEELDGERRLVTVQSVGNIGWKIVGVSYMDELMTTREEVNAYLIRVVAVALIIVLLVGFLLARSIIHPLKRVEKMMRSVERGQFDAELPVGGPLEVERLSRRFNLMIHKIRQLMEQIVVEQESKRKHELEALQAQINPHFLYNTLNTVVRMAGMSRGEEVVTMITSLSKLFRISLSKGRTLISVRDELEHAHHYLTIQQMRFGRKFTFSITATEEAEQCLTLKLVLQPLLENAIEHGLEYSVDEGSITLDAAVEGDMLVLRVEDNGAGMTPEKAATLLHGPSIESGVRELSRTGKGSGVALRNIHDRIRLYYGAGYGLEFQSELEEGTTVWLRIPAQQQDEGDKS
ncbi:two-component system, sensor histidine kinase YesM [Paenibacillaceae bacterium GAS479]|nr:two-component system, sensor histidine kinase YesM [Paenibacillaceae bacterium GAS479]